MFAILSGSVSLSSALPALFWLSPHVVLLFASGASLPFWPCSWSCPLLWLAPQGSRIIRFNSALACDNAMILVSMQVLGTPVFCVLRGLRGVGLRSLWAYIVSSLSSAGWVWCPTSSRSTSSIAALGCLLRRPILHPEAFLKHTSAND